MTHDSTTKGALLCSAAVALLFAAPAKAERVYQYVDASGVTVITNIAPGSTRKPPRGAGKAEPQPANGVLDPSMRRDAAAFDPFIGEACALYKIPVALARAVMAAESNFDPLAVSAQGAQGLMQLMPETAAAMFVADSFDPKQNIHGGIRYLRVLANLFEGDMVRIIAAYNAGPDAVRRAGGIPEIPETQEYVRRVIRLYFSYKGEV